MSQRVGTRGVADGVMGPVEGAAAEVGSPQRPAARTGESGPDTLEQYVARNDEWSGMVGGMVEAGLLAHLKALGPGGRVEIDVGGRAQIGPAGFLGGRAKATVQRTDDGVVVKLGGGVFAGAGVAIPELGDASISVMAEGGLAYRFKSDKEAADILAAMIQTAPLASVATPAGAVLASAALPFIDPDAPARVALAGQRLESVEGALKVSAMARASLPAGVAKLDLMASVSGSPLGFKLDLARGELIVDASFETEVKAGFWYQVVPGLKLGSQNIAGEEKGRYSLEAHYPLSREDIASVAHGKLKIADILADPDRRTSFQARAKITGQLAGLDLVAEKSMPIHDLVDLMQVPALIGGPPGWTVQGYRFGVTVGGGAKAGLSELRGTLRADTPILDSRLRPAGFAEEIKKEVP